MELRNICLLLLPLVVSCFGRVDAEDLPGARSSAAPTKSALLIGIDTYAHSAADFKVPDGAARIGRFEPQLIYPNLKGPSHDVDKMREVLTSEKFGFPNDERHIHVLLNNAATHDAILKAMQQYLVTEPNPGDTVVLFISSHGSLRADPKGHGQLYDLDGTGLHPSAVENSIVPYDWYLGKDDIFSRDLRHVFNQAAARGIHLTAIFDSCHSGSLARGAENPALVPRDFAFDPRPMPDDPYPAEASGTPPENRADNPVLVLSAAQRDQLAIDVQNGVPPHGLFTNTLVETLQALPAGRPASDVFKRLQVAMEMAPNSTHQQPELDTSVKRKSEPLFGGAAGSGPPTAAIVSVDANSSIVLDIGLIADIGPGSEFTEVTENTSERAVLQITDSIGLARSKATVVSQTSTAVHAKDIVQLSKWVPAQRPNLGFYAGVSNPSRSEIEDTLAVLRAAHITFVGDPTSDPWSHHLAWDGKQWILYIHSNKNSGGQAKKDAPTVLGARLSLAALKKLPSSSIVWFDAPLPSESKQGLLPKPTDSAVFRAAQLTQERGRATYVIAGTPTDTGMHYAWFKRSDIDAEVQTPKGLGAGCSPNSAYPLRTDWVDSKTPVEGILTESAIQLARLNGWLQIASSSLSGQTDFAYRLHLRSLSGNEDVLDGGKTYVGKYGLWLEGNPKTVMSPRWVYVLEIDCQGKGTLLWPYEVPDGKFPTEQGNLDRIPLPGEPFEVSNPLGTDTYLMLTTATPLADRSALEFAGVATRSAKSARSAKVMDPLEELLDATSAGTGTRAAIRPTPTSWGIQTLQTQSLMARPIDSSTVNSN
jgi:hypothetical protein